ncbi:hypothetical protein LRR18_16345, partial [Mangrovimonas sp. AS39]|nr:hypothetical protein [Mangrovimonas futianensis]
VLSQPNTINAALKQIDIYLKTKAVDIIVLDSVAAGDTAEAEKKDAGVQKMGDRAAAMSAALRRFAGEAKDSGTLVWFLNQIRMKMTMFGDPRTQPGGESLKYYASVRLELSAGGGEDNKIKDSEDMVVGRKSKIKVIKSKICPPWGETEITITFGKGVDYYENLTEVLIDQEVIEKSASWLTIWGQKVQGRDAMAELLRSRPQEAQNELKKLIAAKFPLSGDEED